VTNTVPKRGKIVVVDDSASVAHVLAQLLRADGYTVVTASNGKEAMELASGTPADLFLLDIRLPERNGFAICRDLKADPGTRLTPVVLMTGSLSSEDRIRAIEAGADDFLTKPLDVPELRARVTSLVRLKHYTDELDSADAVILALAKTIEARDPYTEGHCERLAAYAVALGAELHLADEDLVALHRGGYLHDLGKIAVPDSVLAKPGPLTRDEFAVMKQHPIVGERLCGNLRVLNRVRPIVRSHHERIDGTGYPDGLGGGDVPLLAQIVGIVDVFDAVTTARPYKQAMPVDIAYNTLREEARRGWRDSGLVDAFIHMHTEHGSHPALPKLEPAASDLH
jgi:cyclic di-GMP phosphodiesterase